MALNTYRVQFTAEYACEVDGVDEIAEVIAAAIGEHATVTEIKFQQARPRCRRDG